MKKAIVLVSLAGLLSATAVFGQVAANADVSAAQAVQQAETVTTADLGVTNPGLLPTNPFYFFKEFGRNIQRALTFNPVAKAQLEVKITNEKAAEAKKIQETVPNDDSAITKGIKNYQAAQERVKTSLESLGAASTTPEFEKLMNSVATNVVLHQKVLDEMGVKASDSVDVKDAVDSAKVKIDESAVVAVKDDPADFANKLQNALIESGGSELKHVRSVEIITNIETKAPEVAKPALLKVREELTSKLNESVQEAAKVSTPTVINQMLKEIPASDSAQRTVIVNQLQKKMIVPTIKVAGTSTVSAVSVCDALKASLEKLTVELKNGNLTEEQYKLKYESGKKELELCINRQQPQPTTTSPVQKETPVLNTEEQVFCTMDAKLCPDGSYVGRTGPNCEFKCPAQSESTVKRFSDVYVQCYDGKEFKDSVSSCKTSDEWQAYAKQFCDGHCYADNSKCGVNSFSISNECGGAITVPAATAATSAIAVDCGKEKEKVNRDPLAGPVTKQCCFGLKEDRSNKLYSICFKPEESANNTTTSVSVADSPVGIANPASVYCVKQGYKGQIITNSDGSQYGVCIFNDGSKCEEWAYYKGECKPTMANPALPTTSSGGSSSSIAPSTSNTNTYSY